MSARNRELFALIPVAILVVAGFTAVFIVQSDEVGDLSLIYGGYFVALCVAAHILLRIRLPHADPYIFPLVATLAAIGLIVIYRIDADLAVRQASLFLGGLLLFGATIIFLKDYHLLERYRYLIAIGSIILLFSPFLLRNQVNGAYLQVNLGPLSFQPSEFAKIGIVVFLASYLAENREMLSIARPEVPGGHDPAAEALRAADRGVGRGDADAVRRPRPGQLADVLRRLPGRPLRGHVAPVLRDRRLRPVPRRRRVPGAKNPARPGPRRHLAPPVREGRTGWRGPDPAVAVRPGGRRAVRHRPGRVAAALPGSVLPRFVQGRLPVLRLDPAGAAHGLHLRGDRL